MKPSPFPTLILAAALAAGSALSYAAGDRDEAASEEAPVTGFEKPYAAEREAFGFDPEGVEYKQNRLEDFQVILLSSAPWAALFSFSVTSLVSKIDRGTFKMDKGYSKAFLYGTVAGAAAIATLSVAGPKYNPPPMGALPPPPRTLVYAGPIVTVLKAQF
jgi:hypothetical protein